MTLINKTGIFVIWMATCILLAGCAGKNSSKWAKAEQTEKEQTEAEQIDWKSKEWDDEDALDIPAFYDSRTVGRSPSVKNQGSLGTCWAFASLAALEASLLPEESLDFSEDNMSLNKNFFLGQNDGGDYTMSMAYLLSWQGPVLEKEDPYGDKISPSGLKPAKHVQEIQMLEEKDYDAIKQAVLMYGGVQSSLYTSLKNSQSQSEHYNEEKSAYYYDGKEKPNHDSVIIGWDDGFPKENFNSPPPDDGAFLCMNSWGDKFGDGGCFYVSYYDTNIGIHNIVYTVTEPPDNYDNIYQTDLCGWIGQMGYGSSENAVASIPQGSAWFSNVYEAQGDEVLKAVGFYAIGPETSYEVYVVKDVETAENLKKEKNGGYRLFQNMEKAAGGKKKNMGYYTVLLDKEILLDKGERFAVVVKIDSPGQVHPVAIEYDSGDGKCSIDLTDGEGYISLQGDIWERVEEKQECNICLKAYTKGK